MQYSVTCEKACLVSQWFSLIRCEVSVASCNLQLSWIFCLFICNMHNNYSEAVVGKGLLNIFDVAVLQNFGGL